MSASNLPHEVSEPEVQQQAQHPSESQTEHPPDLQPLQGPQPEPQPNTQQQHSSTSSGRATTRLNFSPSSPLQPRIHVDQQGRVRLDMGRGNVMRLPTVSANNNGQINVRVLQIDPLMPQPVQDMSSNQNGVVEDESWSKYKCAICCEFMNDPVGCGNCASRFCHACLNRVAAGAAAANNINNSSSLPKCPTCRVEFRFMVRDVALKDEMMTHGPTVPCCFEGCLEQLKLPLVADHENRCGHALMKCRYASFGCKWTGKRDSIFHHENNECHLAKVSNFIDEFRKTKGDHSTRLDIFQRQVMGSMQMNTVHRQSLQRDQMKSCANVWDLLLYCHVVTCSAPLFFYTKDKWVTLFRPAEGRAAVVNFLVFLPTMIMCAVTASSGFRGLLRLLDNFRQPTTSLPLEDAMICVCIGMLGVLLLVANFVDGKSSQSWRKFSFRCLGEPPVMCDVVAISSFTIHLSIMEYQGAGAKAFLLWVPLTMCTTLFPALVATLSHTAARNMTSTPAPTAATIWKSGRTLEPFLFGLRYSILATFFGVLPCLDASILVVLFAKPLKKAISPRLVIPNCFLEGFPKSFTVAYFGAKTALLAAESQNNSDDGTNHIPETLCWMMDSILAVGVLMLLNVLINQMFAVGVALGEKIAAQAQADVRSDGIQKDHNLTGIVCFFGWVCMLGMITQFQ